MFVAEWVNINVSCTKRKIIKLKIRNPPQHIKNSILLPMVITIPNAIIPSIKLMSIENQIRLIPLNNRNEIKDTIKNVKAPIIKITL